MVDRQSFSPGERRLRIVLFAPHFAEYCVRLAIALSVRCDVLLVAERRNLGNECNQELLADLHSKATVAIFSGVNRSFIGQAFNSLWVPSRIRRFSPDLVHVQEQGDPLTTRIVDTFRRRSRVVLTVHDPRPHSGADTAFARSAKPFLDRIRSGAHGIHIHGAACEALLRTACRVTGPVLSTPHGVLFVPDASTTRPRRPASVLFFGRMEDYKGLDVLLDAFDELQKRGCRIDLTIAGRGPALRRASDRIAQTPGIRVIDRFLTPAEATVLFQESAIVTAPYRDATQSGIVAAAFGNGRPVVASRVGGLVDAVTDGDNGLLVPPNDPIALADALESLLADVETIDALSAGARRRAETHLDWSVIARSLETFYREIVMIEPSPSAARPRAPDAATAPNRPMNPPTSDMT